MWRRRRLPRLRPAAAPPALTTSRLRGRCGAVSCKRGAMRVLFPAAEMARGNILSARKRTGALLGVEQTITNISGQCHSLGTVAVHTCSPSAQGGDTPLSPSVVRVRASAPAGASLSRRGGRRRPAPPSRRPPARRPRARRQPPCSSTRARGRRSREPRLGHPPWPASVGGRARRAPRGHAKPAKRRAAHELAASWQPRGRPLVSAARSVPRRLGCERREGRAAGRRAVVAACVISRVERGCERHGGGLRQLIAAPRVREAGHGGRCLLPHASRPGMPSVHRAGAARGAVLGGAGPASGGCRERWMKRLHVCSAV